ncbi:PEP-CTERM sorting domain-containing protein [Akkermansia sp.]|uniref:PEP-CTERM sorting domain-containing protein n=1 Tax=Akkermansia sp. TaxID=1872421 RepID=UPI0025C490CD|nr:PEP-CTERM sorting domain-containing protein [Akkermansia sp.]MCC8149147.1 PEP-CTERM sorting domain-containing protein [Akkermansia sp.]
MKKTLSIAVLLSGLCVCANAASMVTEWTGAAGPTEGNTYELGNAGNWSNGVPSRGNGQGPDVIFNNTGTININGNMADTSDGGSITVTGNSNVTVGGTRWTGNVTIGSGSTLNLGQVDFKSSDITLDGTLNLSVCGIDSGGNGARLIFGIGGIMNVNQQIWGASSYSVSGLLATTSADLAVGEFQFVTRTLVTSAGFDGGSISLGDFTAEDGSALTKASGAMEGNAADYQGQYYLYTENGDVKVQYVVAGAVPEPATATLSLLGLAALTLRRRRA